MNQNELYEELLHITDDESLASTLSGVVLKSLQNYDDACQYSIDPYNKGNFEDKKITLLNCRKKLEEAGISVNMPDNFETAENPKNILEQLSTQLSSILGGHAKTNRKRIISDIFSKIFNIPVPKGTHKYVLSPVEIEVRINEKYINTITSWAVKK